MLGRMALVAAAALIVFPMSATGELQPSDISKGGVSGSTPRIASDGAAGIVAVWREVDGDTSAISAAFRPAGGSWSASERISTPAAATESPKLAMDRLGNLDRGGDVVFGGSGLDFYSLDRWLDHARSIESRL